LAVDYFDLSQSSHLSDRQTDRQKGVRNNMPMHSQSHGKAHFDS